LRQRILLVSCTLLTLGIVAACSKSTSPSDGTNGTGSGPSFNFTFPATGTSSSFTFPNEGTFGYHCMVHGSSGMTGTVIVSASASGTLDSAVVQVGRNASNAPALAFNPSTVTVKPGGIVRWVNPGTATNHTVTRP
jgi:plastocyanin